MSTYIAFLRAINVGGRFVKMQALREYLEAAGFDQVETHIQSGNVRLASKARNSGKVEQEVEKTLSAALGFDVTTLVRTPQQLRETVSSSPSSPLGDGARHYLTLLKEPPSTAAVGKLEAWDVDGERLQLAGRDLHLWITKPYNEVKASNARMEKLAGVRATTRDWKVMTALAEKWA